MKNLLNNIVGRIATQYPHLKDQMRTAHIGGSPQDFIKKSVMGALPLALGMAILAAFVIDKADLPLIFIPIIFVAFFAMTFQFGFYKLRAAIIRRQKEIDREVLFVGQYLLIKLYAGKPLLNALIDTSESYGVASKYIKEIIHEIDVGTSLEEALNNAMIYSPSEKFKKILFHINNALRLGIEVAKPLQSVLDEITRDQKLEITRYGKKLNSLVIFYMIVDIVLPSIGMTIFLVFASFINITIGVQHFAVIIFFMLIMHLFFISLFKTIRPSVNL